LVITLTSPRGTVVKLTTNNGRGNDNVFDGTVWDDDANPAGQLPYTNNAGLVTDHPFADNVLATALAPQGSLGAFIGEDPKVIWPASIAADESGDIGELTEWSTEVTALPEAPPTLLQAFNNNTPVDIVDDGVVTSTIVVSGAREKLLDLNLQTCLQHGFL